MEALIFTAVEAISLLIGSVGIAIIVIGAVKGLYHYMCRVLERSCGSYYCSKYSNYFNTLYATRSKPN